MKEKSQQASLVKLSQTNGTLTKTEALGCGHYGFEFGLSDFDGQRHSTVFVAEKALYEVKVTNTQELREKEDVEQLRRLTKKKMASECKSIFFPFQAK